MLTHAAQALDRAEKYAEQIDAEGATIETKHGLKEHPLLKHELAARAFVVRTLQRLGLDVEPKRSGVGRPTGGAFMRRHDADET